MMSGSFPSGRHNSCIKSNDRHRGRDEYEHASHRYPPEQMDHHRQLPVTLEAEEYDQDRGSGLPSSDQTDGSSSDGRVNFPFLTTPSGNLKVIPQQVVYESKQLSIVAANPRKTKVNIKSDNFLRDMSGVEKKTCALPADLTKAHLFKRALHGEELRDEGMLKTHELSYARRMPQTTYHYRHPHGMTQADGDSPSEEPDLFNESRRAESSVNEKKQIGVISINQLPKEVNLEIMGFKNTEPINWNTVELPPKTDLHALLHYRITNYISPDVLVKISNHEYRCHLLVLQCYSGFFVDQQPPMQRIEIAEECVTKSAFAYIYDWMIHRGTDSYTMLKRDNILDIFMGAQYLQVKELEEQCWAFIDNEDLFSEDQAFLLYLEARKLGNTAVMELMVPRIQRFFLTLVASKDFLDLVEEEVSVFLRSNYICVHSEMEVFMSAVRWLTFDWDRRQKSLANLMACVRFGLIAPWQLVDIRRNPENQEFLLVTRDPIVAKMIEDGLAFAIIKNMYGHDSSEYSREIETLGLSEPQARNWAGTVKKYMTYNEFLLDLQNYRNVQKMAKNQGVGDRVNSCESVQSDLEHLRKVVHRAI